MTFNLSAFVRDQAQEAGIPDPHLSAVEHRASAAVRAADSLGRSHRFRFPLSELGRRIVHGALEDHRRGLLERRIG